MNTTLRDLSIVYSMIHCCIMLLLLYESRYSRNKTALYTWAAMVPLSLLNGICLAYFGIETTSRLMFITYVIPSFILFFCLAKNQGYHFVFSFCLCNNLVYWVMVVTNLLDTITGVDNYVVMFGLRLILYPLIEVLMVRYMRNPYREFQNQLRSGWGIFSICSVIFYLLLVVSSTYPSLINERPYDFPTMIIILVLMPVIYVTIVRLLTNQLRLSRLAEERHMLNMQIKSIKDRLQASAEYEGHLRILRHDTRHRIVLLKSYLQAGETEKALEYLNTTFADVESATLRRYCENNSLNAVMDYFCKQAKEHGVALETHIALPEMLSVPETDIAILLSNALDNAISAVSREEDKTVTVKSFAEGGKLYLEVKNPFHGTVHFDGDLPTTEKEGHGYGTKSMASVVKRNDGIFSFTHEDGYFVFRCAI